MTTTPAVPAQGLRAVWASLTWTMLAFCAVHLVANVVVAVLLLAHRSVITAALEDAPGAVDRVTALELTMDLVSVLVGLLTVTGLAVAATWLIVVRRLTQRYGVEPTSVLRHRAVWVTALLVPVSLLLSLLGTEVVMEQDFTAESARGVDLIQIVVTALRMVMAVLLAVWARSVLRRVRAMLAAAPDGPPPVALPTGLSGSWRRWRERREQRAYG